MFRTVGLPAAVVVLVLAGVMISWTHERTTPGAVVTLRSLRRSSRSAATAPAATPGADSVVPFGGAPLGPNSLTTPDTPVVGMAPTPDGKGYWLVAADGGVFTFGDAAFYGSEGGVTLNSPVVGMAPTPDGKGYWLVAADGGIFTFGDAAFYGSTGDLTLNSPVVGMAPTPDGKGYWLVAADGGSSPSATPPSTARPAGCSWSTPGRRHGPHPRREGVLAGGRRRRNLHLRRRRLLRLHRDANPQQPGRRHGRHPRREGVLAGGGRRRIFTFGDAAFYGSAGGMQLVAPVVGMASTPTGNGYWLATGSPLPLAGKVVGIDPGHNGLNYTAPQIIDQPVWNGQEDESCDTTGTATDSGYTEAQYNFNVATYLQADLEAEGAQVVMTRPNNAGIGPCVTTRAAIINDAHADVAVDIHADGGPAGGRGFAVLEPVADGPNDAVIASSDTFATIMRNTFLAKRACR